MTALTTIEKASELLDTQQYAEAEKLFLKALGEAAAEKDTAIEITVYNCLGQLFLEQGEYAKAEANHTKALQLCKDRLDENVSETILLTVSLLCSVYEAKGQFDKALSLYDDAINTASQMLGKDDPDVAIAKCSQAAVYFEQGQFGKAQKLYEEALPVISNAFPDEIEAIEEIKSNLELAKESALETA